MRFVLSLAISFLFFFTPAEGNAYTIQVCKSALANADKTPAIELVGHSTIENNTEAIILFNKIPASKSQSRFPSLTNFLNNSPASGLVKFLPEKEEPLQQRLQFKTIGSKLIFPEHYFW